MIRKYSLVMESGPAGYSAYVPELPSIVVTGSSAEELMLAPRKRSRSTGTCFEQKGPQRRCSARSRSNCRSDFLGRLERRLSYVFNIADVPYLLHKG